MIVLEQVAAELYRAMGAHADQDPDHGFALACFCAAMGVTLQRLFDLIGTDIPWAPMLDVDECPGYALPWLAQMVGLKLAPGLDEPTARATVRDTPNFKRGTVGAMVSAAQRTLTGTQTVLLFERDTSAYHLAVVTRTSETPSTAATLAALTSQKPGGIVMTYVTQAGEVWDEATATWDAAAGSWQDTLVSPV